jgi:hypothetical protein
VRASAGTRRQAACGALVAYVDADDMDEIAAEIDNYALGRSAAETQRLILQNQIYGPFSRQFLSAAGITGGMNVLDFGSGREMWRCCWLIWLVPRAGS